MTIQLHTARHICSNHQLHKACSKIGRPESPFERA
jgi:hypothetical protein